MVRGLLHEIVRRRLWPIPVVALLVAVAAPLLFMKSSPGAAAPLPAKASEAAVDVSADDGLPVRARQLLQTTTEAKQRAAKKRAKAGDPFQGPKGASKGSGADAAATPAGSAAPAPSSAAASKQEPVPVVITDSKGKVTTTKDTGSSADSAETSSDADAGYVAVDVRYAANSRGSVRRAIPRLRPFTGSGRVLASFVRYSTARDKAIFAVSPNTWVRGSVDCRKVDGECRFVELAVGKHAWLSIVGPGKTAITRRLSVVRAHTVAGDEPKPPADGSCLLRKLQRSELGDAAVLSGACD